MSEEPEQNPTPVEREPKSSNSLAYWIMGALIVFVIIILLLSPTLILSSAKNPDRTEAISNLKQIGSALHKYHEQFGTFPNDQTVKQHPSGFNLSGTSSNAIFRQLFAAEIVDNEEIFYAKFPGIFRPDNNISNDHLLEKGEVAFAYIAGLSNERNPSLPIAFGPVIPGSTKFDPKPFDSKAIVLRIDGSTSVVTINKNGDAMIGGGESLLDPNNRFWNGKTLDIRYPE